MNTESEIAHAHGFFCKIHFHAYLQGGSCPECAADLSLDNGSLPHCEGCPCPECGLSRLLAIDERVSPKPDPLLDFALSPTEIKSTPALPDDEGFDEIISRVELDSSDTTQADLVASLAGALRYAFQHLPPRHQEAVRAQLKGAGL